MGDSELQHVRSPEPLTITILRVRNLKGQRGDIVNTIVKVEFNDKVLGESPKVECTAEAPAEINYQTNINVTFEDPLSLDELCTKPVLCTVIEVLPKEKKQKEEKTLILGQCSVDLLPIIAGETKFKHTLTISAIPESPLEKLSSDMPKPELDIQLSVNEPILSETQLKDCNLMSITVESLYSPPDSWAASGSQFVYTAVLPVPLTAQKENPVVFTGGVLKPGVDKEPPSKFKKWAMPGNALSNAVYIPDKVISGDPVEDEDGDYRGKEDREHRLIAEQDKNRVLWNVERRSYLESSATKRFGADEDIYGDKIAKMRYWPVEIFRTGIPAAAKGKKENANSQEEDSISFHGVAYLNLAPLLYPGVKRIRGAYKISGYQEHELAEKTQRKGSLVDEAVRIANSILSRSGASPFPKTTKKEDAKPKEAKKPAVTRAADSSSEADGPTLNAESQQFLDNKSYLMVEIALHRPLVPRRQPEELAKRVAEYIPARPKFPKRTDGAKKSVEDFHNQVGVVANLILDEFRDQFGEIFTSGRAVNSPEAMEDRKQKLIYHLNTTGKYFAFKEQLKYAVVKIVREKYLKTSTIQDKDELQAFLSELYVYLIDQMHVGLGKVLNIEDQNPIPEPLTDSAQLKHFAREAEVNENFELAARYYQERIARDRNDPDHWLDYGTFNLYINDLTKAEECFKECVSIDQRHLYGLILYGVVCTMQDKHEAAETFFEAATTFEPKSILAWTILGLFYDGIGNEIGAEMALLEANKLNLAVAAAVAAATSAAAVLAKSAAELEAIVDVLPPDGTEKGAALDGSTESQAALAAGEAEITDSKPPDVVSKEGRISEVPSAKAAMSPINSMPGSEKQKVQKETLSRRSSAVRRSEEGIDDLSHNSGKGGKSAENASRPGSVHVTRSSAATGHDETVVATEDAVPPREPTPVPSQSIFMQVVDFLLEVKAMPFAERALAHHLLDPVGGPSAEYHISLAHLKLQKHQMEEAEKSLQEALQFDHQNPDAWAILGHVKYLVGDSDTAKECYERTLAFIADASEMHSIYLRLASIYLQEGRFAEAKTTFLQACRRSPSCVSWLGVGIACFRIGELEEAEDALAEANILNNTDPEVWAYLSLVCLKTGRELEAEQSYKYALKLNLQDENLLDEIQRVQEQVGFGNPQL